MPDSWASDEDGDDVRFTCVSSVNTGGFYNFVPITVSSVNEPIVTINTSDMRIIPDNQFMVSRDVDDIVIIGWRKRWTPAEALNLAAWLVRVADDDSNFLDWLRAVKAE